MWEVLVGIRHEGCPISDTGKNNPTVHVQNLVRTRYLDNEISNQLLGLRGDPEDIEDFIQDLNAHRRSSVMETYATTERETYVAVEMLYEQENPSIPEIIHQNKCYHRGATNVNSGIEHWTIYTNESDVTNRLTRDIETYGNTIEKYRTKRLSEGNGIESLQFSTLLLELTPRQQEVFEKAFSQGYYEKDEDETIADVADSLDIHHSTVGEHLKKAENTLLSEIGEQLFIDHGDNEDLQ